MEILIDAVRVEGIISGAGVLALSQLAMLTVAIVLANRYVLRRWARMRQARLGRRIVNVIRFGVLWMFWLVHK